MSGYFPRHLFLFCTISGEIMCYMTDYKNSDTNIIGCAWPRACDIPYSSAHGGKTYRSRYYLSVSVNEPGKTVFRDSLNNVSNKRDCHEYL